MDKHRHNRADPWEPGIYETGRTRPPKNHGSLIAFLLVIVIFLGGLVSVLGILNVRLFTELQTQPDNDGDTLSFVSMTDETVPPVVTEPTQPETLHYSDEDASLYLNPSPDSIPNVTQEGVLSLQEIYKRNIDSVVSISCSASNGSSSGTGVIFSKNGYIVTNCHVVEGASSIDVLLTDERNFSATLVGSDTLSDLAVLHINASNLKSAQFGDSSVLQVGDSVAAIGDPLGSELRGTLTNGIISAINRDMTISGRTLTLIQTNAALNSGNSGGPLINCYGQVIGINTMKIGTFVDEAGVEGLGFAIPSATVKDIVKQLIEQGYVSGRPTLGLSGESVSKFYQRYYHMPQGLFITAVEESSDASSHGIEAGDILISVNDTPITSMDDLNAMIYGFDVGDTVNVVIYRARRQYSLELTVTENKN